MENCLISYIQKLIINLDKELHLNISKLLIKIKAEFLFFFGERTN